MNEDVSLTLARLQGENSQLRDRAIRAEADRNFLRERLTSLERLVNHLSAFVANPERVS